jgi:hypothetical protein
VLSLVRRDFLGVQFILLFYALLLRSVGIAGRLQYEATDLRAGYLYEVFFGGITAAQWWQFILSALCIWAQAVILNYAAIQHRISERKSWFIGAAYIFFASFATDLHVFSPGLIANFFFILSLSYMFGTFRVSDCRKELFNTGFFLGLASLFAPACLWLVIPIYFGFSSLRKFQLVEQGLFLTGLILPYFLVGSFAFLGDGFDAFWNSLHFRIFGLFQSDWKFSLAQICSIALYGLAIMFVFLASFRLLSKNSLQQRKYLSILYWVLFLGILITVFQQPFSAGAFYRCIIPIAVFIGLMLENQKNLLVPEVIHALLLLALFSVHYIFPMFA